MLGVMWILIPPKHVLPAPVFYFSDAEYHVDESQGHIDVRVWRTGTDLSKAATVTVRSRKTDPASAEGTDRHHVLQESGMKCTTYNMFL